jgi:hypothetical protein
MMTTFEAIRRLWQKFESAHYKACRIDFETNSQRGVGEHWAKVRDAKGALFDEIEAALQSNASKEHESPSAKQEENQKHE